MFRRPIFATTAVTFLMLLFQVFSYNEIASTFRAIIFLASPLLVIWMVFAVLTDKKAKVKELKDDEEWGYQDKEKDSLRMF